MLDDPAEEIFDVIRWFGERDKIFNVHFRNIRGRKLAFEETFPDEGDVNMLRAAQTYKGVGYRGMLIPDHAPKISGDNPDGVAFAYCYGYIRAVLQAVDALEE
jgi:mannonate dehydratase